MFPIFQDERNLVLTTGLEVILIWTDEFMKWNPEEYGGINETRIPRNKLWIPDIMLYNRYISDRV